LVSPAGVTHLTAKVVAHDISVGWTAATGQVVGYTVYLDSKPPSVVSASVLHDTFTGVTPGTHYIQVVTKSADGVSNPVATTARVVSHAQRHADSGAFTAGGTTTIPGTGTAPSSGTTTGTVPNPAGPAGPPGSAGDTHAISGSVTVDAIEGPVNGIITGDPDVTDDQLTGPQLNQAQRILDGLKAGKTYPCPLGAGGGFADLVPGGQVTVANGSGSVLADGSLTGGVLSMQGCTFDFSIPQVPQSSFYQVTVTHRGALTYSLDQMESNNWTVTSTVG
jgi:hypothetical protein